MFDRFFDCLNTRRLEEGREKRKPDLDPYKSDKDSRLTVSTVFCLNYAVVLDSVNLQWLEKDFLGYLRDWDKCVSKQEGYTKDEKQRMTLSKETLKGLIMTGTVWLIAWSKVITNNFFSLTLPCV